ncbi:hypothetical protein FBZ85_105435 [Azospirillum brasilense]|uniref:hypothetical protein n=2 Tax=Azospirillum baldaniorum TaxID=1064539 RepID=UPI00117C352B|nr:hypothetical protein [Azospirillum baldaniorum]TWA79127.1 hypothetical protein FBZ85_105435 [Azospirillum brasilense]
MAARLKADPGFADALRAALGEGVTQPVIQPVLRLGSRGVLQAATQVDGQPAHQIQPDPTPEGQPDPAAGAIADVLRRVEVLEAHVADLRGKAGRQAKVASQQQRLIAAADLEGVMTRLQYAAHIGVSNPTLTRWVKRGMPVRDDGLLDVEAVESWRKANESRLLAERVKG